MAIDNVDHIFNLRDSRANSGRLVGEGVHSGLDYLVDYEDAQDNAELGNIAPLRSRNFPGKDRGDVWGRGSGETGVDMLFKDPLNTDLELVHLYKEFVRDTGKKMYLDKDRTWLSLVPVEMDEDQAKSEFELWLNKRDGDNDKELALDGDDGRDNGGDEYRVVRRGKNEFWRENGKETILKAKNAIFDEKNKLNRTVQPLVEEFVKSRYFADSKEEALKKVQDNDLGKSASEFLMASEFLHFLKDKKRWDVVGKIERKSSTVKTIEKGEVKKADSLDLKLNKRRIESHLEPDLINHVDRFVAVYGSGEDVTKVIVDTKKGAVSAIKLIYNSGAGPASVFLTTQVFHNSFDGVSYYKDSPSSDPTGLSFIDKDGDMLVLNPKTTDAEAKAIFSQLSIDGKKLTGDFEVVVNKS